VGTRTVGRLGSRLSSSVRDELTRRIAAGDIAPGSRLPAEPTLAAELKVSRATLREALRWLEEEGYLTRTPGAGTFVIDRPRLRNNLDVNFGVTEAIRAAGMEPGTRDLRVAEIEASADEARRLAIAPGEPLIAVERVRTADARRVVFSEDLLVRALVAHLPDLLDRVSSGSIYELIERDLGLTIHHGVANFRPMPAARDVAGRLGVRAGTLLVYLRQVDYDEDGRPILSSHEFHLADAFEFSVVRRGPGRRSL
jgi:GntR family transcriptional regulator